MQAFTQLPCGGLTVAPQLPFTDRIGGRLYTITTHMTLSAALQAYNFAKGLSLFKFF